MYRLIVASPLNRNMNSNLHTHLFVNSLTALLAAGHPLVSRANQDLVVMTIGQEITMLSPANLVLTTTGQVAMKEDIPHLPPT